MEGISAPSQSQQETPGLPQCVDALPTDILSIIFCLSLPYSEHAFVVPVPSHHEVRHNISHVSYHWRQIALAQPQLWTELASFAMVRTCCHIMKPLSNAPRPILSTFASVYPKETSILTAANRIRA